MADRFRVRYKLGHQRLPREDVLDLIDGRPITSASFTFSARPVAGTVTIPKHAIIQMLPIADSTPITLDHIYRGPQQ